MGHRPRIDPYKGHIPVIDEEVWVDPDAVIIGEVRLRRRSNIWPGVVLRGDQGGIDIGEETSIQDGTIAHATLGRSVTRVGDRCTVGHRVILHGCTIGDNVLVGMGATIMNGAVIGENSIIGAGALITEGKNFPPYSLILGAPARASKTLDPAVTAQIEMSAKISILEVLQGTDYLTTISKATQF